MALCCQVGESGRSVKELEKTVLLLKKVVEKTRAENEQLKRGPGVMAGEKLQALQTENTALKVSDHTSAAEVATAVQVATAAEHVSAAGSGLGLCSRSDDDVAICSIFYMYYILALFIYYYI